MQLLGMQKFYLDFILIVELSLSHVQDHSEAKHRKQEWV